MLHAPNLASDSFRIIFKSLAFFVSKFYLCRVFKGYSGTSIHAYINKKRIMMAKEYIENGMSARAASEAVGYQDYSAFYRAYVKIVGKSPTA
jgi:AraC-like DNA-binding protein